jgi:hypothetical protein
MIEKLATPVNEFALVRGTCSPAIRAALVEGAAREASWGSYLHPARIAGLAQTMVIPRFHGWRELGNRITVRDTTQYDQRGMARYSRAPSAPTALVPLISPARMATPERKRQQR